MCINESLLWLYVYCEIWHDAKYVPCVTMGRGEYFFFFLLEDNIVHFRPGSTKNQYLDLVERLGDASDARRMDGMVGAIIIFTLFTHLNLYRAMVLFLASILSFVWRTGAVSDPSDPPPLSNQAALGPRILITSVLFLGLGYMAMIILTLKNYGSYGLPTRASANMGGMGTRNIIQGGGIPTHGNTTGGPGGATGEKNIRARDIDAAMERRGRQRERSASIPHIRRKEENVEQRQLGGPSVADSSRKGGRNSKGMHGLGFGSQFDGELEELSKALKIDGLP